MPCTQCLALVSCFEANAKHKDTEGDGILAAMIKDWQCERDRFDLYKCIFIVQFRTWWFITAPF